MNKPYFYRIIFFFREWRHMRRKNTLEQNVQQKIKWVSLLVNTAAA